jgi:5'-3' exonuclease
MSKLNLIIDKEEKVLLLDSHNAIFRTLYTASTQNYKHGLEDNTFSFFKYLYIQNILKLIEHFNPTKVIIAMDSKMNWRKDVYKEYKAQRKAARDSSKIDFEKFFPILDDFLKDLKETFSNMYFMNLDKCEGDDIIAVTSKHFSEQSIPSVIVSTDRDMYQLQRYKNIKQFDPMKRKFAISINPITELECKIITGDKGDNIPAIKPKCGPVTAAALMKKDYILEISELEHKINEGIILESNLSKEELESREHYKNYLRNRELIDFEYIPNHIKTLILNELNTYTLKRYNSRKMLNLIVKHRLGSFLDNIQEIASALEKLD